MREVCALEVRFGQIRIAQVRAVQVGAREIGLGEVHSSEVAPAQVGVRLEYPAAVRTRGNVRGDELTDVGEIRPRQVRAYERIVSAILTLQVNP
jgi:hypothetical protein